MDAIVVSPARICLGTARNHLMRMGLLIHVTGLWVVVMVVVVEVP